MDTVTAALNALAATMQFLCTPPGQKLATDFESATAAILQDLHAVLAPTNGSLSLQDRLEHGA